MALADRTTVRWCAALIVRVVLAGLWGGLPGQAWAQGDEITQGAASAEVGFESHIRPFLREHCLDCHSGEDPEGGFAMGESLTLADMNQNLPRWRRAYDLLRVGAMPPPDLEIPPAAARQQVVDWLYTELFTVDCTSQHDPGRVTVRRLNQREYANTIRDLFGDVPDVSATFPTDDGGYGFDNIGDVLTVSPLLLERYIEAAERVSMHVIRSPELCQVDESPVVGRLPTEGQVHVNEEGGLTFSSVGEVRFNVTLAVGGTYRLEIAGTADYAGQENPQLEIRVAGGETRTLEFQRGKESRPLVWSGYLGAGEQTIRVAFVNDFFDESLPKGSQDRNVQLTGLHLTGPQRISQEQLPVFHRQLVSERPRGVADSVAVASRALTPFLKRAFRRPPTPEQVDQYAQLVKLAMEHGDSFERGLQVAIQGVLVAPNFLFRLEGAARPGVPADVSQVDAFALATRLSYFLWRTMPDDRLLEAAERGELLDDAGLRRHVQRMLRDPRAQALSTDFAAQWLGLSRLKDATPSTKRFPEFNPELAAAMRRETELLFQSILDEDRSLMELLTAEYTFVNESLAKLYGLSGVAEATGGAEQEWQRVSLVDSPRVGLLGHASVLTLTSYPQRTSPVQRGEFILANILGEPPPAAPPVVPSLADTSKANPDLTLREQMELHRADPGCASCHRVMDALGFGLENFDAIGRYRETDDGQTINAAGELPSGEQFRTQRELVALVARERDKFADCLARKLLTYGLGRGIEPYDVCAVNEVVQTVGADGYRLRRMVEEICLSQPFRFQRARPEPSVNVSSAPGGAAGE